MTQLASHPPIRPRKLVKMYQLRFCRLLRGGHSLAATLTALPQLGRLDQSRWHGIRSLEWKECQLLNRTAAQEVLRQVLWPTIRTRVLMHVSQFSVGERQDFCPFAALPAGHHLGCD